jgi:hypothetical protein
LIHKLPLRLRREDNEAGWWVAQPSSQSSQKASVAQKLCYRDDSNAQITVMFIEFAQFLVIHHAVSSSQLPK